MSNHSTNVLASIFVFLLAGFYSQPLPVSNQANYSVTSRGPSARDDENLSATCDDNADDSSDDFVLTSRPVNRLTFAALVASTGGNENSFHAAHSSRCATLESQHILLRL